MTAVKNLVFDIETAPALAEVWGLWDQNVGLPQLVLPSRVISWAAKWHGARRVYFASEYHDGKDAMLGEMWDLLDAAQIVTHYNGTRFDEPHLNREFLLAELGPPSPFQRYDLMKIVKNRFRFMSNKLEHITTQVGLAGKVKHDGHKLWADCLRPDVDPEVRERAWRKMRTYNKGDVVQTDELLEKLIPWLPASVHQGLLAGTVEPSCGRCGSTDLEKRGLKATALSTYQQYRCNSCGSWSRGGKRLDAVDVRGVA